MSSTMAGPLHAEENYAFMTVVLRVDVKAKGWQKVVSAALSNIRGVRNFKMVEDGKIEVSGTVDPNQLLKMLATKAGRKLVVCEWQYGECHSNLYLPEKPQQKEGTNFNGSYGYDGGYYGCSPHCGNGSHLYCNLYLPEKPQQKEGTNFNGSYGYDGGYYGCSPYCGNGSHLYCNGGYGYGDYPWSKYPSHASPGEADRNGTVPGGEEPPADQKLQAAEKSQAAENPLKIAEVAQKQCCSVM